MAPKIFLTGVTGYIGGDAFYELYNAHPDYEYTLLVRNEERGKAVTEKYPKARLVYGSLNDSDVIEKAAAAADVVIHTANSADDIPSATAIAKGLAAGHSAEKPGAWIHISGTGELEWYDERNRRFGQAPLPEQKYDDLEGVDRVVNMTDLAMHRDVDKLVLAANDPAGSVRTTIVAPPTIYGPGRGPVNQRSMQVYDLVVYMLRNGYAPIVKPGLAEWDNVHVHDLSAALVALTDAALDSRRREDPELFGPRTYYFLEHGTHLWADVARWVADAAYRQGFMAEAKTETLSFEEVMAGASGLSVAITWAANSKGVAKRARKYLNWTPRGRSLKDEVPDIVATEAKRLGIKPTGHKH